MEFKITTYSSDATKKGINITFEKSSTNRDFEVWCNGNKIYSKAITSKYTIGYTVGLSLILPFFPNEKQCYIDAAIFIEGSDHNLGPVDYGGFTFTIPNTEEIAPSITVSDLTPVKQIVGAYVENHSAIRASFSDASAKFGASVSQINFYIGGTKYDAINGETMEFVVPTAGANRSVYCEIVDSRGISRKYTKGTIDIYSYQPPQIDILKTNKENIPARLFVVSRADRNEDSGTIVFGGSLERLYIGANLICSPIGGGNKCTLKYRIRAGFEGSWGNEITLSENNDNGTNFETVLSQDLVYLNNRSIYYVELIIEDTAGNRGTWVTGIPSEKVFMERSGKKNTIAFGGHAVESNAVEFHEEMRTIIYGELLISNTDKTKMYKITIDDNGNLKAEEVAQTFSLRNRQGE